MATWIALLRGINVGGNNILPMAELRADLEGLGFENVRTYIQSGNVVFDTDARSAQTQAAEVLAERIGDSIESRHGFRPRVLILEQAALQAAVDGNPFPEAGADPKTLHFSFLAEPAGQPDLEAIDAAKSPTERYRLIDQVFYLHAPDGIGRSKLAGVVEKRLGVQATARNYRTVEKLLSMASGPLPTN